MRKRFFAYMILLGFVGWIGISAKASHEESGSIGEFLTPNLDSVRHVYPQESYVNVIDTAANIIKGDTASLDGFMEKLLRLRSGADEVVSIVHLGDSHVQGGFWDARLRELFQCDFGNAGRGLITPYKLAGGNEPRDYAITTKDKLTSGKVTSRGLVEKLGFTGVAVGIEEMKPTLSIWSKAPFSSITIFHHAKAPFFNVPDSLSIGSYCTMGNTDRSTRIDINRDVENLTLVGELTDGYNNPTVYGFSLENGQPGVLFHAIGVNSAAFEHFERNTDFAEGGAAALSPDLIIISLGTNNCFGGNYRSDSFREVAEGFVRKVHENYPESAILLTTPMEGCRRIRRTYSVNKNVSDVAEVLGAIANDNGFAVWDFYTAAGGNNSSRVWYSRRLMQSDRLHLTEEGYTLQGDMLYDALMRYYNSYINRFLPAADAQETREVADTSAVESVESGNRDNN